LQNWAGNITFTPHTVHRPQTISELQELVADNDRVRALGTGHSFTRIADTPGALIRVDGLPDVLEIGAASVRVGAGVTFGALATRLWEHGLAIHNMASLPHISVAGGCATGTHGSGNSNGSLAAAVNALDIVTADGSLMTVSRESADFDGMVVALGSLGIVTTVSLDVRPTFDIEQYVYDDLEWPVLIDGFDEIFASAYSVSVFTRWRDMSQIWVKHRAGDTRHDLTWTGARPADGPRHPIPGMSAVNCTEQMGVPGPWHERLPHFRMDFTPSAGDELQSEFLVPRETAAEALRSVERLSELITPVLQISEIRTVAPDTAWLSPSHGRDSVALHFTWIPDAGAVTPVITRIEQALARFDARPHWGKVATTAPDSYPRRSDFQQLLHRFDPAGKFRNDVIDRCFPR
jgi:xylitol oxidase